MSAFRLNPLGAHEIERLNAKLLGAEEQVEAVAEHLSKIPKDVSPDPIFRQMQRLEGAKNDLIEQISELKASHYIADEPAAIKDYLTYGFRLHVYAGS